MNLVGRSYIAAKSRLKPFYPQNATREQTLTQQFFDEWSNREALDDEQLLRRTLNHARHHVSFYGTYFAKDPHKDPSEITVQFSINLFYYQPWLDEFQVVQKDYELIQILYKLRNSREKPPTNALADIEAQIRQAMTPSCEVEWQQVPDMPTTRAGKRLYVRSDLRCESLFATLLAAASVFAGEPAPLVTLL